MQVLMLVLFVYISFIIYSGSLAVVLKDYNDNFQNFSGSLLNTISQAFE